jgi:arylsulfatase A-like enzyme
MWRIARLLAAIVLVPLIGSGGSVERASLAGSSSNRPSIILILTDDQRFDTLSAMPNVESLLAAHGVTFHNDFVVNSLCCPSRTSILTGNYSHTTHVYKNLPPNGGFQTFGTQDRSTVATWLEAAGYRTALVGKYLNGYEHTSYVPPGWDRWVAYVTGTDYYDYTLDVDGRLESHGHTPSDYSTDVLTNYAVDFVKNTTGPIFLYFAPNAPHQPAFPEPGAPDRFADLSPWRPPSFDEPDVSGKPAWVQALPRLSKDRIAYADSIRRMMLNALQPVDHAVGRIVDALAQTGRLNNTMIVFTSDNGFMWGEHRWIDKLAPYEESIRVPLVVRFDPITSTPKTSDKLALNIDLAPTFAQVAGVAARRTDGQSLLPVLEFPGAPWRQDFLVEHLDKRTSITSSNAMIDVPTYCEVRTTQYAYVQYVTHEEELYDLSADPYELRNLAQDPTYHNQLLSLRARLAELCNPPPPGMMPLRAMPSG